ncbi:MAG TPA: AtpZ/AtpI family protein [Gemmatimonadales bacterium]|nr:AtpZ/AtpI family protein [Gemmatimonadales bacterium]
MPREDYKPVSAFGFGEGVTFAFAILGFGALGWLLDGWIHTRPLFAVVLGLLGGFGAFMNLYYRVQREIEAGKKREERSGKREA